jgi:hypothetical protein
MKGRTPTADEKRFMGLVGQLGCIVCSEQGYGFREASLHHIDGRTKPGAHMSVIPLCYEHHQGGSGSGMFISVHPWKRRFEEAYGSQVDLLDKVRERVEYPF